MEESFLVSVACYKSRGRARKPRNLNLKSGEGLEPSSLLEVYVYVSVFMQLQVAELAKT